MKRWGGSLRVALIISGSLCLLSATHAASHYTLMSPPLAISLSTPVSRLSDFIGISLGLRKLTSDIAWIQTLVYYGTREEHTHHENHDSDGHPHRLGDGEEGKYLLFLAYCQRVARIDPQFKYIYYYGGAVLGWNLNRPDEAEILLKQGIEAYPKEWRYQQFLAALTFQKTHNTNDLIEFLEAFSNENDCPNILRSILANIYKKQTRYMDALRIWILIYDSQDESYRIRATEQIEKLSRLVNIPQNRP
jgi:tetratricopeptide (TPR) repeat protein